MSKMMTILEEKVAPVVNKIGAQRHLRAVRNGLISMLPLTIVGSFFVIFLNVPIEGYGDMIKNIRPALDIPFRYTVGLMAMYPLVLHTSLLRAIIWTNLHQDFSQWRHF